VCCWQLAYLDGLVTVRRDLIYSGRPAIVIRCPWLGGDRLIVRRGEARVLDKAADSESHFSLIGRDNEIGMVRIFLNDAVARGSALAFSSESGMGKTVMLDSAVAVSSSAGMHVLRAAGAELEANVDYSGLHQVLSPLLSDTSGLASVHESALSVAMGFAAGSPPGPLVVANATIALLRQIASVQPLLVVIDDVQWLDRASIVVLALAAPRGLARVGFLWAVRSGQSGPIERSGIPTHVLQPLSDEAAGVLLDACTSTLAARVRQRLIVEAQGNQLALTELATALSRTQLAGVEALPSRLRLSARPTGLVRGTHHVPPGRPGGFRPRAPTERNGRGRDRCCQRPSAQIPACAANALGSCLGCGR